MADREEALAAFERLIAATERADTLPLAICRAALRTTQGEG